MKIIDNDVTMPHSRFPSRLISVEAVRALFASQTLFIAALIGALAALATIGFREGIFFVERAMFGPNDGLVSVATRLVWWQRLISPAIGGAIAGLILTYARRQPDFHAGGDYMEAASLGNGDLGVKPSLLRAISATATIASGGAIGREGPMVQLAALAGSLIGRWSDMPIPRRRLFVACGAAAGLATAYNAPIAGAVFVAEIVLRSVLVESLGPLLVAAFVSNIVVTEIFGYAPVYDMPVFTFSSGGASMVLAAIGILAGLVAPAYLFVLDRSRESFKRLRIPLWAKLGLGGLLVGAISIVEPGVWGNGYSVVNSILQGNWLWQSLLAILAMKLLAVATTTGSGAVGGIFTPTLFVGAIIGALFGGLSHLLWPDLIPIPAAIAVGMGAFLSACTHAPLMSVLMMFEMTGNYSVVVPLMAACIVAYSISRALHVSSIYPVIQTGNQQSAALAIALDLLHKDPPTISMGLSMRDLDAQFAKWRWQHLYVTDEKNVFLGAISLHDFSVELKKVSDLQTPWPSDLLKTTYPHVNEHTPIWAMMEVFVKHPGERLPVLNTNSNLMGYITKTDVVMLFRDLVATTSTVS